MWCPECNISGGCDCHITKKVRYVPRDHKKELEQYESEIDSEVQAEIDNVKHLKY